MALDLRLYALLDPAVAGGRTLIDLAKLLAKSATLVQLRDKHSDTRLLAEEARALRGILAPAGVPLLINDRVDVALAAQADGVHLGQDDMAPAEARRLLGPKAIIGLSIGSVEDAKAAPLDFIDYAGVGAVYATSSKADADAPIGVAGLRDLARALRGRKANFPICGISGINKSNAGAVIEGGADGVAVVSALSLAPDPGKAAEELRGVVDTALKQRGKS
jgi:thiamine-phosphate pyrophosphorylase